MNARPLHPNAALLLEGKKKYIAVSDLHIGLESELGGRGITMRSSLLDEMQEDLLSLLSSEKADALILLGDVKNTVGSISKQEWDDMPQFFKKLSSVTDVYLVPGNHDGNIRHLVPDSVNVIGSRGMVIEDTLFTHGHSLPSDARSHASRIVMGHLHPVFIKAGSVVNGQRVWIYMQVKKEALFSEQGSIEVIVVPSFNRYLYAEGHGPRRSTSPIISRVKASAGAIQKCVVATLDGSIVGDASLLQSVL